MILVTIYDRWFTTEVYFTRTILFPRPLFHNKANVYLIPRAISRGLCGGSNLLVALNRFDLMFFKGYECDPRSATQVETS